MKHINRLFWMLCAAICVPAVLYVLLLSVRAFLFDQFITPTASMEPTLHPGDRILVDKRIMGARIYSDFHFTPTGGELKSFRTRGIRRLRHNDIVVFNFPHHDWRISFVINNVYCKRCIALPGDTLWTENGYYKNNNYQGTLGLDSEQEKLSLIPDSLLPREVLHTFPFDAHFPQTIKNLPPVYIPRKGDVKEITPMTAAYYKMPLEWETGKHVTWDWERNEVYADGQPMKRHVFAHDYYFMAGDNVTDSNDSRYWGLVPEEYIVGVVTHITYSRDRQTDEIISDRIWKRL